MATKIFHGPPGSYKASTAMWFEIVPALRQGRVVVSNLQGLKSLDEIQYLFIRGSVPRVNTSVTDQYW